MTSPAPIATGSRERRRATPVQYPVAASADPTSTPIARSTTVAISASLDARVERGLDHVDGEVEEHEEQRQHQDRALQQRQVALEDRGIEEEAGTGPGEHRLDQDRAAEEIAELQAHDGKRGRGGVLDDVEKDAAVARPLARKPTMNSWARISATSARTV